MATISRLRRPPARRWSLRFWLRYNACQDQAGAHVGVRGDLLCTLRHLRRGRRRSGTTHGRAKILVGANDNAGFGPGCNLNLPALRTTIGDPRVERAMKCKWLLMSIAGDLGDRRRHRRSGFRTRQTQESSRAAFPTSRDEFSWSFLLPGHPAPEPNGCAPPVYSYGKYIGQDPDLNIRFQMHARSYDGLLRVPIAPVLVHATNAKCDGFLQRRLHF